MFVSKTFIAALFLWKSAAEALLTNTTSGGFFANQKILVQDSTNPKYRWDLEWEYITQTGQQTGNAELQDYVPSQVQINSQDRSLNLVLQKMTGRKPKYLSGKIRTKRSLAELAPIGGEFEMQFRLPQNVFRRNGREEHEALAPGLWPAIWLVPRGVAWPTGGEVDLMEMMHRQWRPDTCTWAFSTLHFGPRRGIDAVYDGNWGLPMAYFQWSTKHPLQTVIFQWSKNSATRKWMLRLRVNNNTLWEQTTDYTDRFLNFEKGKTFQKATPDEFTKNAPGDPVAIFQTAFDKLPIYINVNLAFGGTPFGIDKQVDMSLERSVMNIASFKLWRY